MKIILIGPLWRTCRLKMIELSSISKVSLDVLEDLIALSMVNKLVYSGHTEKFIVQFYWRYYSFIWIHETYHQNIYQMRHNYSIDIQKTRQRKISRSSNAINTVLFLTLSIKLLIILAHAGRANTHWSWLNNYTTCELRLSIADLYTFVAAN